MTDAAIPADVMAETADAWRRYLNSLTPFRPALHREPRGRLAPRPAYA